MDVLEFFEKMSNTAHFTGEASSLIANNSDVIKSAYKSNDEAQIDHAFSKRSNLVFETRICEVFVSEIQ